jgi:lipoyl(octanoyl) transferase
MSVFIAPDSWLFYPILDMRLRGGELRRFMHDLEQAVIDTAQHFGIRGERWPENPGVWVEGKQLAAIGLHLYAGHQHARNIF